MKFVIPGQPVAWQRPQRDRRSGRTFTALKTARFEDRVAWIASQSGLKQIHGPVMVTIRAFWEWPRSSWRKKEPRGVDLYDGGPDADNVAKAVLDGLRGYFNDRQVAVLHVHKWRAAQGDQARTEVEVEGLPLKEAADDAERS
jgi:Holliday junction resolvase RusA-like endonuclease